MSRDSLIVEYNEVRASMRDISPKTSMYKDLEVRMKILKVRIDTYHDKLSPIVKKKPIV